LNGSVGYLLVYHDILVIYTEIEGGGCKEDAGCRG